MAKKLKNIRYKLLMSINSSGKKIYLYKDIFDETTAKRYLRETFESISRSNTKGEMIRRFAYNKDYKMLITEDMKESMDIDFIRVHGLSWNTNGKRRKAGDTNDITTVTLIPLISKRWKKNRSIARGESPEPIR